MDRNVMARLISIVVIGAGLAVLIFLPVGGMRGNSGEPPGAGGVGLSSQDVLESLEPPAKPREDAAAGRSPALRGRIMDEAGRPLRGAKVILYGGIATRWKIDETETDAGGRYRFEAVRSTMIESKKENRWDQYVGLRVEHPTHVESDGRSWRDVRIPGVPGHVETLDLRLTPAGHIEGVLKDAKTGKPLNQLDLRIMHPTTTRGHGSTFHVYATTDGQGRFHSLGLFPGEYDVEANSTTLDYPLVGQVKVKPGKTTFATFDAVSLPKVIEGRVLDAAGKPLDGVEVTLLAPKDSDVELHVRDDFSKLRTRAWTITRPSWQERFRLAFLPGLEQSRFVLAVHDEQGWAKAPVESPEKGEPIRLRPWKP
jgi:protocatechuate 3,4-dioxygenase beta subunit